MSRPARVCVTVWDGQDLCGMPRRHHSRLRCAVMQQPDDFLVATEIQVAEIQAVDAAYPGCLKLSGLESQAWQAACRLLGIEDVNITGLTLALPEEDEHLDLRQLSGTCDVEDVKLHGAPVRLRFALPHDYPDHAPAQLAVECGASSAAFERLDVCVKSVAAREAASGACCLLTALQELKECAEALPQQADEDKPNETASTIPEPNTLVIARQLIWFHHIKSTTKRKIIVSEARALNLGGASKPGFPGVVVVEGEADNVKEFTARIRALSWQAMQVRGYEEEALAVPSGGDAREQYNHVLQSCRRLPQPFVELPETGLSELAEMCTAGGLTSLYKTAMKLT